MKTPEAIGERKRALRLKMFSIWEALEANCTEDTLRQADRAWRSYRAIVALEASLPGEARRHLEAIKETPEFVQYQAKRTEYRRTQGRRRAAKWYSERGKDARSNPEKRSELAAARRTQRTLRAST
jgi:hypothetical protein